jgi:hypothetical protein
MSSAPSTWPGLLLVNSNLLIDVGDLASSLQAQWQSLLTILAPAAFRRAGSARLQPRVAQHHDVRH